MTDPFLINIESQIRIKNIIEKLRILKLKYGFSFIDYFCVIRFGDGNGVNNIVPRYRV